MFTWNAIEYIVNNPPYISLVTNNVKLVDSTSIKLACNTLFLQIGETCDLYKQNKNTDFMAQQYSELSFSSSDYSERLFKDINQVNHIDSDTQLNLDTIVRFMPTDTAIKFINAYDLAGKIINTYTIAWNKLFVFTRIHTILRYLGHGYITLHMFMKNVDDLTKLRTDLINNLLVNTATFRTRRAL